MKVPILMYHRVADDPSDRRYTVAPKRFEQQMRLLRSRGYRIVNLEDVIQAIEGKIDLSSKVVALTFDDGFKDTYNQAAPILRDLGFTATFFVVSGLMGKESVWMRQSGYESARLMDWMDALRLHTEGFTLGSHAATHVALSALDDADLAREIEGSKREIEDRVGAPVRFFAYPYGIFNARERRAVEHSGFTAACGTQSGFNNADVDRYALRRIDVHGTDSLRTFSWSLLFGENSMSAGRVAGYYSRRAWSRFLAFR
jgi:peptidoglycan/xylan/chitin deacetylase (PgdA/CDA1 family)